MLIPDSLTSGTGFLCRVVLLPAERPLLLLLPPVLPAVFLRLDPADDVLLFLAVPEEELREAEEVFLLREVPVFCAAILSSSLHETKSAEFIMIYHHITK